MEKTWKLLRTTQCKKCPFKVSTNPHDIPDGYCEIKHQGMESTITDPEDPVGEFYRTARELNVMACHHSTPTNTQHCVGWIANQIGPGNNIRLRLNLRSCENARKIKTVGEQHENFKNTLPKI